MDNPEVFIDHIKVLTVCVVCGWTDGKVQDVGEICPCCFVEWGYEDVALSIVMKKRKEWINSGYKWHNSKLRPVSWSAEVQLKNIPEEYRE